MNPIQLFDADSSTYTYILFDVDTREALLIDPVDAQLQRELRDQACPGSPCLPAE